MTFLLLLTLAATDYPTREFQVTLLTARYDTGLNRQSPLLNSLIQTPRTHHGYSLSFVSNRSAISGLKFEFSQLENKTRVQGPQASFTYRQEPLYLLFGTQLKRNRSSARVKPYVHFMGGASRISVSSPGPACAAALGLPTCPARFQSRRWSMAGIVGGGIDLRLSKHTDLRLLQLEYFPLTRYGATLHSLRIGFGIVLH
jgi:hypothetical protein